MPSQNFCVQWIPWGKQCLPLCRQSPNLVIYHQPVASNIPRSEVSRESCCPVSAWGPVIVPLYQEIVESALVIYVKLTILYKLFLLLWALFLGNQTSRSALLISDITDMTLKLSWLIAFNGTAHLLQSPQSNEMYSDGHRFDLWAPKSNEFGESNITYIEFRICEAEFVTSDSCLYCIGAMDLHPS